VFGPDPAQAKADAELEIPRILIGEPAVAAEPLPEAPQRRKRSDRPATIAVSAFNRKYVLRLNSRKQYRCKVQGEYINCTGDPDQAPHIFKERLLAKLFPEKASTGEVTLESAIGTHQSERRS
jgi:hypothetical protein